jgi:hypothetical protein
LELIKAGAGGWEELVPHEVAVVIKERCLFGYPCKTETVKEEVKANESSAPTGV